MMTDARKIAILAGALRRIRAVRDYHAERGEYPTNLEADQSFDDWAADTAHAALAEAEEGP